MFYDVFVSLCNKKGVAPTRAAIDIGLSKSTPTTWKKRGLTPQGETLNKIAAYFDVSIDYLLGNEPEIRSDTSAVPARKLRSISRLEDCEITPEQDEEISNYIDYLLSKRGK